MTKRYSRAILFEELEPRLLFSADALDAVAVAAVEQDINEVPAIETELEDGTGTNTAAVDQPQEFEGSTTTEPETVENKAGEEDQTEQRNSSTPEDEPTVGIEQEYIALDSNDKTTESQTELAEEGSISLPSNSTITKELVLVNDNVGDYEELIANIGGENNNRSIEVILLDGEQDGIDQVTKILAEHNDLDAIHFMTHGSDGAVALGSDWLNHDSCNTKSDFIRAWSDALTETGDILFYGCDIAASNVGLNLLKDISELTGADVAASDDKTGAASLGGDWVLEYRSGIIETEVAISELGQQNWQGVLAEVDWNTFLGGDVGDDARSLAVDASGNVYVVGYSASTWGTPVHSYGGGNDAYVTKFDTNGNLLWNTFLGGSGDEQAFGVNVDATGNIYVVGQSTGTWGTPVRAYSGGADAFVAKLDSSGAIIWNTFLGSGENDWGYGIDTDSSGNIYISGTSNETWGSPVRAFSTGADAFTVKLNSSGTLVWNTFLGGTGSDGANGLEVDDSGNIFVAGFSSATWGTPVRSYSGSFDALAMKLNNSGVLTWHTFMGGSGYEVAEGGALDTSGNFYLTGRGDTTWGTPIQGYGGGSRDALVVKVSSDGNLGWNTFAGGTGVDYGYGIAVSGDSIYLTGSSDVTWGTPWRTYSSGTEGYLAEFDINTGSLTIHGFLGGSGRDVGYGVAVDGSGGVYVAGESDATWGTPQSAYSSGKDAFITKIGGTTTNTAPTTSGIADFSLNEDYISTTVLYPHFADAEDADEDLVYSITKNTNTGLFDSTSINGSGVLTLNTAANQNGAADITVRATDTGGLFVETTFTVTVTPVNDTPEITPTGTTLLYTENDGATAIDPGLSLSDPDSTNLSGATVQITGNFVSAEDVLGFMNQLGITGSYDSGTGILTLAGTATVSNYETALRSVTYWNMSQDPDTSVRTISFAANDGINTGVAATRDITVTSVNDTPAIDENSLTISESQTVTLTSADIYAGDVDHPASAVTITASNVTGGHFAYGSAQGTPITSFTQQDINDNLVVFVHDGGEAAPTYDITAWDGVDMEGPNAATITFSNVNDAPELDSSGFLTLTTITEDATSNSGTLISDILASDGGDSRISDPDPGALEGIAITGLTNSNGTWEYNIGLGWNSVGAVSETSAFLLRATDRLRFVPNGLNSDLGTVLFSAWDQTSGTAGTLGDRSSTGGSTAFSSQVEAAVIYVTPVNDAPSLSTSSPFTNILEDDVNNSGMLVSAYADLANDVDSGDANGIAITSVDDTNGTWQYTLDGVSWSDIGSVSTSGALLLPGDGVSRFRFVPKNDYTGSSGILNYKAWDQTEGASGDHADVTVSGGTSAYSFGTNGAALSVIAVNDAPVLGPIGNQVVEEGSLLTFTATASDVDVPANTLTFSLSGTVPTGATIDASTGVFTWTPTEVQGPGVYTFDVTVSDGTLADSETITITVNGGNDAPVLTSSIGTLSYTENSGPFLLGITAVITDVDSADFNGGELTVQLSANGLPEDRLTIRNEGTGTDEVGVSGVDISYGGITVGTFNGPVTGSTALIVKFNENSSAAIAQAVLRNLTYENTSEDPSTTTRTIIAYVSDGDGGTSDTVMGYIAPTKVNDAPTVSTTPTNVEFVEDEATFTTVIADIPGGGLTDVDNTILGVAVTGYSATSGTFEYSIDGGVTWHSLVGVSDTSARLLRLTDMARFTPSTTDGGTLSISYRGWDQTSGTVGTLVDVSTNGGSTPYSSDTAVLNLNTVSVNDAPIAVSDRPSLNFDGVNDYIQIADDSSLFMSDTLTMEAWINPSIGATGSQLIINKEGEYELGITADTGEIIFAIAEVGTPDHWTWHNTGYFVTSGEWTHVAVTYDGVAGEANTYINGVLVDTFVQAGAIGDVYTAYNDLMIGGRGNDTDERFDGQIADVRVWTTVRTESEISANQNTTLTGSETGLVGYWLLNDGSSTTAIDSSLEGNDGLLNGGATWSDFTVDEDGTLTVQAPGILINDFDADGDTLTVNTTPVVNVSNGSLILNSDGSFTYTPNADFNGVDSFTYEVSDGNGGTDTAVVSITVNPVNDAPVITLGVSDSVASYDFESGVASGISGAPDITVNSPASISTSDGASGSTAGLLFPFGDNNSSTHPVSISSIPGVATSGEFSFAADVRFDTGDGARFWETVFDFGGGSDNNNIWMGRDGYSPNDLHVTVYNGSTQTGPLVVTDALKDIEGEWHHYAVSLDASGQLDVYIDGVSAGSMVVDAVPVYSEWDEHYIGSGSWLDDSQFQGAMDNIAIFDTALSAEAVASLASGLPAVVGPLQYNENDPATKVLTGISLSDVDDTNLESATVSITGGHVSSEDVLAFTNQNGITGSWNATTGTLTLNGSATVEEYQTALRSITYENTSDAPDVTVRTVSWNVNDGTTASNVATSTINITATNDAPVAVDDAVTVTEDVLYTSVASLVSNDTDLDLDSLSVIAGTFTTSQGGTLTLAEDGSYTYISASNFSGTDTVNYTVTDGNLTDTGLLTLTVTAVNDAPILTVPGAQNINEDMTLAVTGISVDDADSNVTSVQLSVTNGTVIVTLSGTTLSAGANDSATMTLVGTQAQINVALATLTYRGSENYNGTDSLAIIATDGGGLTDSENVVINVASVTDLSAADDSFTTDEEVTLNADVSINDSTTSGGSLSYAVNSDVANGTLSLNSDGTFSYTADANFTGNDSFTYTVTDSASGESDIRSVDLTINTITDLSAQDDSFTTDEDVTLNADVSINDSTTSGGSLSYAVNSDVANGTLSLNSDGSFSYTADANFNGSDSFTYTVTDSDSGESDIRTVNITINAITDLNAQDDSFTTDEEVTLNADVSINDSTTSGGSLSYALDSDVANGTLSLNTDGTFTYTADANFNGSDSFTYTVTDSASGESDIRTVDLTITAVTDLSAADDSFTTDEDVTLNADVSINDSTTSGGSLSYA
ncbi:tandem-95 repeat protein, partial [Desulforhopalus sp. IMCC35007]|uniref:tandem-95 repeat protein n=1 Tax=Desulforhopalus sp. IMCC35007 TaxID=2569543 RepID=UPI0010AEB3F6